MSKASSTPASDMRGPPAPKNFGARLVWRGWASAVDGVASTRTSARNAFTNSAASRSPLGSPAMSMNALGFISFLIGRKEIPCQMKENRGGKAKRVDAVHHSAVSFQQVAVILDAA